MKKILLPLALLLGLLACKDQKANQPIAEGETPTPPADLTVGSEGVSSIVEVVDTVTGMVTKKEKPLAAISTAIGANPTIKLDPVRPRPTPPNPQTEQEKRVAKVLMQNYWVVYGLVKIRDKDASRENPGAWFKFHPDGSYDYGYMQQKIGTGAWTMDGMKATVHLDSPLLGDDREWKMQIAKTEDVMVWVGTERYVTTGTNMKLINLMFIPKNRKEIGLDW